MPTIVLADYRLGPDLLAREPNGGTLNVPRTRYQCLLAVPGFFLPRDAFIDTGAPVSVFPQRIWSAFQAGIDYELLPPVTSFPQARVAGWQFDYHIARFLAPLALLDVGLTTRVPRPGVVAQFAVGDPPGWRSTPPVVVGLWGGLLEGGSLHIERDTHTNRATGELVFP